MVSASVSDPAHTRRCPPSAALQACPTSALAGGTIAQLGATDLANAIKAALTNALFPGSNAVSDVTLATDSQTITAAAPASSTYTYSVIEVRTATAAAGADCWPSHMRCHQMCNGVLELH